MKNYKRIKESCRKHAELRRFVIQHFKKGGIGAEIGVLYGQFSELIIRDADPKMLYLVDPWDKDDAHGERTTEDMEVMFYEVFHTYRCFTNVLIFREKSNKFFKNFRDIGMELDFIYIDGDHDNIYDDLCGAWEIMKPGGIIAGDDWNCRHWGNKVELAVKKFCAERGLKYELYPIPGRLDLPEQFVIRVPYWRESCSKRELKK